MDIQNLITMANQIGAFFQSMPNRQVAKTDIANHLSKFWEPRMREALIQHLEKENNVELNPLVKQAILENIGLLQRKKES